MDDEERNATDREDFNRRLFVSGVFGVVVVVVGRAPPIVDVLDFRSPM